MRSAIEYFWFGCGLLDPDPRFNFFDGVPFDDVGEGRMMGELDVEAVAPLTGVDSMPDENG